jgi:SPOR domain
MADDQKQQLYRSSEASTRGARPAASATGSDPLAELARLIGQTDPFAEFDRQNARRAAAPPAPPAAPPPPSFGPSDYFDAPAAPPPPHPATLQPQAYAPPPLPPGHMRESYAAGGHYPVEHEIGGHPADEHAGFDPPAYHPGNAQLEAEEEGYYEDGHPPKRRMGIMAIAAVFALAVIGTAGAFGYRAIFGGSRSSSPPPVIKADTAPSKIVPVAASKTPNKLIYDRVADHAQDEKLVSREEKPVEIKTIGIQTDPANPVASPLQGAVTPQSAAGSGVLSSEPKKVHTITIHPDQPGMGANQPMAAAPAPPPPMPAPAPARPAPVRAASNPPATANQPAPQRPAEAQVAPPAQRTAAAVIRNAPLSLNPNAAHERAPVRTAAVAPPAPAAAAAHPGGGYAVQVSSQRSKAEAEAAFRGLQAKFPKQLGGRQALIHKVDLGAKGTYYRAMVGPFANASEAGELCSGLKAAGGQCLIQRN